ncbi:MAG: NUDIX domain-containing protein [Rhabdochlamydiaceae bacterium]|nr:NUDIX domain-containing protein [Rhabdochlamydiaceae bacterium]
MIKIESFGIIPLMQDNGDWKVLLILHKEGSHWSFPKGKADPGEEAIDAAKRELKEETGLDVVQLLNDEPYVEQYQFRSKFDTIQKTVHYFPAVVSGTLQLQEEEIRDAIWLKLEEAIEHLTFKEAKNICHLVIQRLQHM